MSILFDNREHELLKFFQAPMTATLPVGDIWIGVSGEKILPGGIVLERKAIADMESSMSDGRYREQRTRLQAFAQENGCHIAYVFEGSLNRSYRFSKEVMMKWLVRLPFVHKIPYFQTVNTEDTALLVNILSDSWKKDEQDFREGKVTSYTTTIRNHTKGEQRDDPHIFACSVLSCCKGISPATAEAILKQKTTLEAVMAASEDELAKIQVSEKRKLGPAIAKKLYGLLHYKSS